MSGDLLRETERATIITLKANAPLLAIVAKASIEPNAENPEWPFTRLDGTQAIPQGRGCTTRSDVTFMVHSFAKPRYVDDDPKKRAIETARDHCARINSAVVDALHNHRYTVAGVVYKLSVRSSRLMQDGAERDAYHGVANILARAQRG
ncbi:hypothetical protein WG907_04380 [Sphingobium sp. AN558]|uniref:hypothetical protein n=1 Tax=Sphingobium sp. AN558 TaxID=3133442 RepID=UPI0030C463FA